MFDDVIYIKGIKIHNTTFEEILDNVPILLKKNKPFHIVTLNANMFYEAQRNEDYKYLINHADLVVPDGSGILLAAKLFGYKLQEKISGIDLFKRLLFWIDENKEKVFFLGSSNFVIGRMIKIVQRGYKHIRIVGRHHGFFDEKREKDIVEAIRKTRPNFLFIGMGAFKQEIFAHNNKKEMQVPIVMGVGGSFDVMAGKTILAPNWIRNIGLEWLFRLVLNPKRITKVVKLPLFLIELIWYRIFRAKVL